MKYKNEKPHFRISIDKCNFFKGHGRKFPLKISFCKIFFTEALQQNQDKNA